MHCSRQILRGWSWSRHKCVMMHCTGGQTIRTSCFYRNVIVKNWQIVVRKMNIGTIQILWIEVKNFGTILWEWYVMIVGAFCWIQVNWLTHRLEQFAAATTAVNVIVILRERNALSFPQIFIRSDIQLVHTMWRTGRGQRWRWIQIEAGRSDYLPTVSIALLFGVNAISNVILERLVVLFQRSERGRKRRKLERKCDVVPILLISLSD